MMEGSEAGFVLVIRIREAQKHMDPLDPDADPDPQHWFKPQVPKTLVFVLQAIRDGVIEASLDHENGWMQSKDTSDIYATRQDHTHTPPVLPEPVFLNVYGAHESIPRNEFRQPM